ncbi:MAG: hypothetical protein DDT25_00865 [Chloroflexi bacterium]|nr:hypothetical protein [Chloroflexota bacterium]
MTCHSPWACPVCAPRVAARRGEALIPQVESMVARNWSMTLITLTARHKRNTPLPQLLKAMSRAWSRVSSGRWFDELRTAGNFIDPKGGLVERPDLSGVEFVRGYDFTWSDKAGWHPHFHIALFLGPHHSAEDVAEELTERWRKALLKEGFTSAKGAQHYERADDPKKAAKYAVTPAACYESIAMANKRARGKGAGLTPFEILARAVEDHENEVDGSRWVALWREYVSSTKGKRQSASSSGIDLDPPEVEEKALDEVLNVGPGTLREMDKFNVVPDVLSTIEQNIGDPEGMRDALRELMEELETRD